MSQIHKNVGYSPQKLREALLAACLTFNTLLASENDSRSSAREAVANIHGNIHGCTLSPDLKSSQLHRSESESKRVVVQCGGITQKKQRCLREKTLSSVEATLGHYCHDHVGQKPIPFKSSVDSRVESSDLKSSQLHRSESESKRVVVQCGGITQKKQRCLREKTLSSVEATLGHYCHDHVGQKPIPFKSSVDSRVESSGGQAAADKPLPKWKAVSHSHDLVLVPCGGTTQKNQPYKNKKTLPSVQAQLGYYCHYHGPGPILRGYHTSASGWVEFDEWIPAYLQPSTQAALRMKMMQGPAVSDEPGYIYAFEIKDPKDPQTTRIKVGREKEFDGHAQYWIKHFGGPKAIRHFLPGRDSNPDPSMIGGMAAKIPCYKLLESLILTELRDLIRHAAYHDTDFRQSGKPPAPRVRTKNSSCIAPNCDTNHTEVFCFDRSTNGNLNGIDDIVCDVIQRWSVFCNTFCVL